MRSSPDTYDRADRLDTLNELVVAKPVTGRANRGDSHLALLVPAEDLRCQPVLDHQTHLVVKLGRVADDTSDDGIALGSHEAARGSGNDLDGVGIDVNHAVSILVV